MRISALRFAVGPIEILHYSTLLLAFLVRLFSGYSLSGFTGPSIERDLLLATIPALFIISAMLGIVAMCQRNGNRENIFLGFTTIIAATFSCVAI